MKLPFVQVDAFARAPFTGNPAAVMPLDEWLDEALLQNIAAEHNLSETAFLVPTPGDADADYELRWFTPVNEVVMCGHATLASGHFVLSTQADMGRVLFRTRQAGVLEVARADAGYSLSLPTWHAEPRPLPEIVAALGVPADSPTFWHHHRYALVVVEHEDQVRDCDPDFRALAKDGDVLTIVTAPGSETDIVSRAFVPGAGIDEDPVTGSAHAVLVPYWRERLGRDRFTAYQASARGGYLECEAKGDRVVLGGSCVTVIEGTLSL